MSQLLPLSVIVNKDTSATFEVTLDGGVVDLDPFTVEILIKAKNTTDDSSALQNFSSPSNGVVVTNPAGGLVQWTIPRADIPTAGTFWWRLDITNGSLVYNVFYGPLSVIPA